MPASSDPAGCHGGAVRPGTAVPAAGGGGISGFALRRGPGASCRPGAVRRLFTAWAGNRSCGLKPLCTLLRVVSVHTSSNLRELVGQPGVGFTDSIGNPTPAGGSLRRRAGLRGRSVNEHRSGEYAHEPGGKRDPMCPGHSNREGHEGAHLHLLRTAQLLPEPPQVCNAAYSLVS